MRERFRTIIENLPPTGIAIHGTTLERALRIEKEGFDPNMSRSELYGYKDRQTFYVAQPPVTLSSLITFKHLRGKISYTYANYAVSISEQRAKQEGGEQALVLLIPYEPLPDDLKMYGTPFIAYGSKPIPSENVLGIIQIENGKTRMDKEIFRDCVALLKEKGVINVGTSQTTK